MKAATREVEQKMKEFKIKDWLHQQKTKKWEFAGHAARRTDERWTIKVLQMEKLQKRKQGGQNLRWSDDIRRFLDRTEKEAHRKNNWKHKPKRVHWQKVAENREKWLWLKNKFVEEK